jgi:hypothetical protein
LKSCGGGGGPPRLDMLVANYPETGKHGNSKMKLVSKLLQLGTLQLLQLLGPLHVSFFKIGVCNSEASSV